MESNIEKAIIGARIEAERKASYYQGKSRYEKAYHKNYDNNLSGFINRKKYRKRQEKLQEDEVAELESLFYMCSVTDLYFGDNNSWVLKASMDDRDIVVKQKEKNGNHFFSVLIDGKVPPTEEKYKTYANKYSGVVERIKSRLRNQELYKEEITEGTGEEILEKPAEGNQAKDKSSRDHLRLL
ncbi:MAG TPA: hypothetical protein PKA38_02315 [Candidatus Levybacteria bacterium]|nr:hypothetical protein [Candidatus Levybacteria bacterium]